jgi:hypothetical protein
MRKHQLFLILLFWVPAQICHSQTNLVFGVKPGMVINSAYLGINQGNFVPFIGVDMLWISAHVDYETMDESHQYFGSTFYRDFELKTITYNGNAFVLIPQLGAKLFLTSNVARPYIFASGFVSFPLVNLDADGTMEHWQYENDSLLVHQIKPFSERIDEVRETIKQVLSFWGFTIGGGAEYFFNPHFSLGGEYGVRVMIDKAKYEQRNLTPESTFYPSEKFKNKWQTEVSASIRMSYAVISANFYF